ncbi:hypothetical protein K469DRAFT_546374, partial [Zopfia rhizophila CBS 207.26]
TIPGVYGLSSLSCLHQLLVAVQCLYGTSVGLIKVSICLFYNRIFPFRWFLIASWTVIGSIVGWSVAIVMTAFVACQPLAYFWDTTIPGGKCIPNQTAPYIAMGAIDVVIDIIMLALPLPLIWKLHVSLADKVAIFCTFGAGISTMAISILRVETLVALTFKDLTYTGAYALLWTFAEPAIGISVACAPLFRPLLRRVFPERNTRNGLSQPKFHRFQELPNTLPSFVNSNVSALTRNVGNRSQVTTQTLESGNWSQSHFTD